MELVQLPRHRQTAFKIKACGAAVAFLAAALGAGAVYGFNYRAGVGDIERAFGIAADVTAPRQHREQALLVLFHECEDRPRLRELLSRLADDDPDASIRKYAGVYLDLMKR
jgi:hypothetical protein